MRQFQKLLLELKDVVASHKPGDPLVPPPLMPSIQINGRRLSYATMGLDHDPGARQPIVLIHGFGGFFMDWPRVMAPLSRHTRVYAIDLPGWGFSEPNLDARSIGDDVRTVKEFLQKLNLTNVILCGISYGAGVAWAAAAEQIPRVQRAVLLNPMPPHPLKHMKSPLYQGMFFLNSMRHSAYWGHKFLKKGQYKLIAKESLLNFRLLDSFYLDLAYLVIKQPKVSFNLYMHGRGARELNWNAWEHRLAGVRIPVTILQGREDRIFTLESARYIQQLIPGSELFEVENCGHAMVFDQHRRISDYLISLLEERSIREQAAK